MQSCCSIGAIIRNMKVIISHRDKYIRKDIVRYLGEQYPNCTTESYGDSMLAAKSVYTEPSNVIIMGIDGIKLIPMLRKRESGIIIVILADNGTHSDEAFSMGANAYLTLPLSQDSLFEAVEGRQTVDLWD